MQSVVLDTIKDIAVILREYDLGGCTDSAPEDEYAHEAVYIFTEMSHRHLISLDCDIEAKKCVLHDIIDTIFRKAFGDFLYNPPQMEIHEVATKILDAYRQNIETSSGKKAKW